MNGHMKAINRGISGAVILLACAANTAWSASEKSAEKRAVRTVTAAEIEAAREAKEARARELAAGIDAEMAGRELAVPPEIALDLEWYSPHLDAARYGRLVRGWVRGDLALLETDKNILAAVRRTDGVARWQCELTGPIRYAPSVSRNNVLVNINNYLVAIDRNTGEIRWRLMPKFTMSCEPLIVDPPVYPREYTRAWSSLESIYAGGWDGRFYYLQVRGRLTTLGSVVTPEFDFLYPWHKTHANRGVITSGIKLCEPLLYYVADDKQCYSWTRDGDDREPYSLQGSPVTGITVTASTAANVTNSLLSSFYAGASDNSVYCLDRLTMKKKWNYPAGVQASGSMMADDAVSAMLYVPMADGQLHALRITPAKVLSGGGLSEIPESAALAWQVPAAGAITAGPSAVYLGLGQDAGSPVYKGIAAVDKASGKVLWKSAGGIFTAFLQFHNSWSIPGQEARVYAITADNRLVSLKEKIRDTGVRTIKLPAAPAEPQLKAPVKKPAEDAAKDAAKEPAAKGGADQGE